MEGQEERILSEFQREYGIRFSDPGQLKLALTHRSYLHVTGQRDSNERLEFLGDSVLGLVTSEHLYRAHPTEHEGQLTKTKSLLVSKAILSRRALAMGLGRFVLMSHSEMESGGRQRLSILADAFEAVIGAIYLDQGFEAARGFIERWLLRDTRSIVADKRHTNYKSHLQEYVQSTYRTHPVYRIRSEMGPDHSKHFLVEVIVGRRTLGEGKGRNKKEAEQAAARDALERVEAGPASDRSLKAEARRGDRPAPPPRAPREPREQAAVAAPIEHDDTTTDETEEHDGTSRRRRRGRRGGRGRRRPQDADTTAPTESMHEPAHEPAPAPAPERRLPPIESVPRFRRDLPPPPPEEAAPRVEFEPLPSAHDEDDLEEVGRPEGPGDESFSWAPPAVERRYEETPREEPRAPVFEPAADVAFEETPEPPAAPEREESLPAVEERPAPSAPRPAPPSYGRRPGRSRR